MIEGFHSRNGFLTKAGYALVAQRTSLEGLTPLSDSVIVDIPISVSASERHQSFWNDTLIEEQYRRFIHGS